MGEKYLSKKKYLQDNLHTRAILDYLRKIPSDKKRSLSEREFQIICYSQGLYEYERLKNTSIAKKFNISTSYVQKINIKALEKVTEAAKNKDMLEFILDEEKQRCPNHLIDINGAYISKELIKKKWEPYANEKGNITKHYAKTIYGIEINAFFNISMDENKEILCKFLIQPIRHTFEKGITYNELVLFIEKFTPKSIRFVKKIVNL